MRKILSVLAVVLLVITMAGCKEKAPQKTLEQLRADSVAKAKKDSVQRIVKFKAKGIGYIERYLKNQCSSDPGVGKVLKTDDRILNDSIYFGKAKVLIKNKYGANQQYGDFWFCVVHPKGGEDHLLPWASMEYCQRGLDALLGGIKTVLPFMNPQPKDYNRLIREICKTEAFTIPRICDDEGF